MSSFPTAHKRTAEEGTTFQELIEHLEATAERASSFAAGFGSSDWARLAGLWHDLGKYAPDWQEFLRSAGEDEAHRSRGPDHSAAGAIHAVRKFGDLGRILAYLIAGHHTGLPDWQSADQGNAALARRLEGAANLDRALSGNPPEELLSAPSPRDGPPSRSADPAFWIRMLFSCLVDADFLDTEAFMDPEKSRRRGRYRALSELWPLYELAMNEKQSAAPDTPVNRRRKEILSRCLEMADHAPSIFTLTVPTGGGKTLASTGFGLKHALKYGKRRIIYVIPYTSIIEQTADVLRGIFGDAVIEHHSNLDTTDPERESPRRRLAAENWDAPVIVTTNVQFFESLFAARTSRCRKLHNIVNSVVILDEVQLLPREFLNPVLFAIRELHAYYKVSFVLSTATQPAFSPFRRPDQVFPGLEGMVEIMERPDDLQESMRRVDVMVPEDLNSPIEWNTLAAELAMHENVLCITHRRDDCRVLHALMPEGTYHLSALMCGAHRSEIIMRIRADLAAGKPARVISTQLVEAGVDLDFPVVYRALAGLDSLAQAAGRCNREGRRQSGKLHIFVPPTDPPPGLTAQAELARRVLSADAAEPFNSDRFREFFRELFWLAGDRLDDHAILPELRGRDPGDYNFRTAASKFRIIDDTRSRAVLVRYGKGADLIAKLERTGPEPWLMRQLQRFVVNLPVWRFDALVRRHEVMELPSAPGIWIQTADGSYDPVMGFRDADEMTAYNPDDLIV